MVEYEEKKEPWNRYLLKDGSKIKVKTVLVSILDESSGTADVHGYCFQNNIVVGVEPAKDTVGNESLDQIEDMGFEVLKEDWSEYLVDGATVGIKSAIIQISRTGDLDEKMLPIYTVEVNPIIKIRE